jgi:enoyl-CoA hydratase/carnithine racemase
MSSIVHEPFLSGNGVLTLHRPQAQEAPAREAMPPFAVPIWQYRQTAADLRWPVLPGAGGASYAGDGPGELGAYPCESGGARPAATGGDGRAGLAALPLPTLAAIEGPAFSGPRITLSGDMPS